MGKHDGKSFHSGNSVTHEGKSNTWFTPEAYTKYLGPFDLDPCTESFRPHDIAKNNICFDTGGDGLKEDWSGRVWLNPPYGRTVGKWLNKLAIHGNGIALVFSRMETKWAQEMLGKATAVFFIEGRITFIPADKDKPTSNAANGSMFIIFGEHNVISVLESGINGSLMRLQERI